MTRAELLAACARGVLFSTPMVQAIYSDQKTRTMRVIDPQPPFGRPVVNSESAVNPIWKTWFAGLPLERQPQHKVGDIVYVREAWQYIEGASGHGYAYKAGGGVFNDLGEWRHSIFMPKAAARGFLRTTGVLVQRPQELTVDEIFAEGISVNPCTVLANGCGHCAFFSPAIGCRRNDCAKLMWRDIWLRVYMYGMPYMYFCLDR